MKAKAGRFPRPGPHQDEFDEASAAFSGYVELVERAVDNANRLAAQLAETKDQLVEAHEQHRKVQTDSAETQAQLIR